MLFENPDYLDLPENYIMTYDLYLWIVVIVLGLISAVFFYSRMRKSEIDVQKGLFLGLTLFSVLYALMRVAYILSIRMPGEVYDFYTLLGYIFGLSGFAGFLFGIEKYIVRKTKFLLTIVSFIVVALGVLGLFEILDRIFVMGFVYGVVMVDTALMVAIYLGLIVKTTGIIRKRTFIAFLCIFALFLSTALDSQVALAIWGNLWIAPALSIAGILGIMVVQRY